MKRAYIFIPLMMLFASNSFAQGQCIKSIIGPEVCAPYGGFIQQDVLNRVVCAPGQCVKDVLNRLWCSRQQGGAARFDNLNSPVCAGGCVEASPEYCSAMSR